MFVSKNSRILCSNDWKAEQLDGIHFPVMVLFISLMRLMDGAGQEIKDEGEVNWEQLEHGGVQNTERLGIGWKNFIHWYTWQFSKTRHEMKAIGNH